MPLRTIERRSFYRAHFLGMWAQVASEFNAPEFPDDMVVLEILNEPTISNAERVDKLMKAYVSGRLNAHEVEAAYYSQMLNSPIHI